MFEPNLNKCYDILKVWNYKIFANNLTVNTYQDLVVFSW
jgi:hypothetical protein